MTNKLLLTIPEACQALGIGRTHLYEALIQTGRLPLIRIGRSVRVSAATVARLVEELEAEAAGGAR